MGGNAFDGRYSGCGLSSIHGTPIISAASAPHAVITSDTIRSGANARQHRRVEHSHPRGALVDLGAGVAVVVERRGIEPEQFDRVDAGGACRVQPLHSGQQHRLVAGGQELQAQCDRRERVPRIGPGDHGHTHRPTLPQAGITTLASMTEQLPERSVTTDPVRVVETFLYALRDKDYDALDAALDDDVVYENVGYSRMRGGRRVAGIMRRWLELPNARFDVKCHRIATEGSAVLTERTDVLAFGPFEAHIWVCGVFEVRDGRITLWRDYIDLLDSVKAIIRGLLAIAIPSLRRTL